MTNRYCQSSVIAQLLQFILPHARAIPVVAASVSLDHQLRCIWKRLGTAVRPPVSDSRDCKLRCSGAGTDDDRGRVVDLIEDAVGNGLAFGFAWEVVSVDLVGLSAVASTRVFEVPDQLSLFSIHTDHRLIVTNELSFDSLDEAILFVALRVSFSDQTFDIGSERETQRSEKLGH